MCGYGYKGNHQNYSHITCTSSISAITRFLHDNSTLCMPAHLTSDYSSLVFIINIGIEIQKFIWVIWRQQKQRLTEANNNDNMEIDINLRTLTFNGLSHVVVDDQRHVLDVDTTPSHVCGHQNVLGSTLETGQSKLSLFLTLPSMQGTGIVLNK